jgi:hypothetical protein
VNRSRSPVLESCPISSIIGTHLRQIVFALSLNDGVTRSKRHELETYIQSNWED